MSYHRGACAKRAARGDRQVNGFVGPTRRGHATLILRETLVKAKERGIHRALITCHKGNLGSAKAILKNGGVLESEELMPGHTDLMQWYWIPN